MPSIKAPQPRLRIFAGPNGSGKTTVIQYVRALKVQGHPLDFGQYINADDIAAELKGGAFSFAKYNLIITNGAFVQTALRSGLVNADFDEATFRSSYRLRSNRFTLKEITAVDRLAQIIAEVVRCVLLENKKRFTFETVFSHRSKLNIMIAARKAGYKVYLYFVGTETPTINTFRVESRVSQGGHAVDPSKIVSRYANSMGLLYEAAQLADTVYFFDNSADGATMSVERGLFASFKTVDGKKRWTLEKPIEDFPAWFTTYYFFKVKEAKRHAKS